MSYSPEQQPFNPYQSPIAPGGGAPHPAGSAGMAIGSLVCGILSLPLTCCCGLFSAPLSIIAIALGGYVLTKPNMPGRGMAIAGIICGTCALILLVASFILILANPEFMKQFQQMQFQKG